MKDLYLNIVYHDQKYGLANHPELVCHNVWLCDNLIQLARDLVGDREWHEDSEGRFHFCVPDVNHSSLEEEMVVILAQIPLAIPDDVREYTEREIRHIYIEAC